MTDTPETIKGEDVIFSHHLFLGTTTGDGKRMIIGIVSPLGERHAYEFKSTGDAIEFVKDMNVLIKKVIDKEEAESNAGRD